MIVPSGPGRRAHLIHGQIVIRFLIVDHEFVISIIGIARIQA